VREAGSTGSIAAMASANLLVNYRKETPSSKVYPQSSKEAKQPPLRTSISGREVIMSMLEVVKKIFGEF
jgi:hypothetical protein